MDTVKMNYFYASQARELGWKVYPTGHSMRVSFVIESIINGVPEEHIINICRWQNDHMLQLYKNNHLEHTKFGSSYRATITNELPHAVPRRTWEVDSTVTSQESQRTLPALLPRSLSVSKQDTVKIKASPSETFGNWETITAVNNTNLPSTTDVQRPEIPIQAQRQSDNKEDNQWRPNFQKFFGFSPKTT